MFCQRLTEAEFSQKAEAIEQIRQLSKSNVGKRLSFQSIFLTFHEIYHDF